MMLTNHKIMNAIFCLYSNKNMGIPDLLSSHAFFTKGQKKKRKDKSSHVFYKRMLLKRKETLFVL